ncbi:hypothetical protein RM844_02865 [Streptomyces sp. DSM 44915]|uniref:Lipoprotein n=1 Tax=Streptomyces chisholmiae TaxID=3075540 RepID=A0ABU2JJR3_9ACTN|nr:hypothetical protein [Streptomyces sp. DSM 44915]MDT0265227.1 hypothetical protein [Streptomyces sp. DSM 44915]
MLRPHARAAWTAAAAAVLLLTTACGGDSDSTADDRIPGVDEETTGRDPEPDPTPEDPAETAAPEDHEIELPADVELVFDWETPEDPDEAAALEGAADYLRAIAHSVVAQDPESGMFRGHSNGGAQSYAEEQVQAWVDNGWTMHGTDRYYDASTEAADGSSNIRVRFCGDSSEMIGKEVATGEPLSADQQLAESLYHYDMILTEAPGVAGFWQVNGVAVTADEATCGG